MKEVSGMANRAQSTVSAYPSEGTEASVQSLTCTRWRQQEATLDSDLVAHEEPLEIRVNGFSLALIMRTPGHDHALTIGFLKTEGVIQSPFDVASLRHCTEFSTPEAEDNVMQVVLKPDVAFDPRQLRRHFMVGSSCGVCGKASLESILAERSPEQRLIETSACLSSAVLYVLPERMRQAQSGFELTGALHAAALFDTQGNLLCVREDVGRHNAVDKVLGTRWLQARQKQDLPAPGPRPAEVQGAEPQGAEPQGAEARGDEAHASVETGLVLMVSGRVSYEIVQKAAAAQIPFLAAVSAPTSLAVRLAEAVGITLVGFLRQQGMNVYSHPQRIDG